MTAMTATIQWPCSRSPQKLHFAMVVKQVTVHGLASQPNRPDAIRQALKEFEDDLHPGHELNDDFLSVTWENLLFFMVVDVVDMTNMTDHIK